MKEIWDKLIENIIKNGFFTVINKYIREFFLKVVDFFAFIFKGIVKILYWIPLKLSKLVDIPVRAFINFCISEGTKVKDNQVMFLTFQGDYTCNPKMIAEEFRKQKEDYDIVWVVKKPYPTSDYPLDIRFVKYGTLDFYKELAASKIIVENTNILERMSVHIKKNQTVFQTWHGSLGIKRLDGAAVMGWKWKYLAKSCQKKISYMLSNSTFESEVFETSYWPGVPALMTGHARNDVFFYDDEKKAQIRHKVYRQLKIDENKKIFLFAPTHRDNINEHFQKFNYDILLEALQERFGGEWQIVIRLHNRLKGKRGAWLKSMPSYVTDATAYEDMQELLVATEVGLTDFSSWIFDYLLSGKPGFVIEIGLDEFMNQRDFYYPIETTPFPVAKNTTELAEKIRAFDEKKYAIDKERFLKERGCMEDGHASERIVAKMKEIISEK